MEATPRSPAKDTMPICAKDDLKGVRIIKTENGLPINVRKSVMENAGKNTRGSCDERLQEALVKRRLSFVQFLLKHQKSEREIFSLEDNDCPV